MSEETTEAAKKPESQLKSFISGGVGGACVVLVGHPLDLVKVRMQTSAAAANASTLGMLQSTLAKEGIRGLYRGVGAPLVAVSPMFAVSFWGYDVGQRLVLSLRPAARKNDPTSMMDICAAGAFSAIPATALAAPTERIKCLLQVQANQPAGTPQRYAGMMDCAWQVLREGGIRSLYQGTLATLLRDVPASVMWFGIYELVKQSLSARLGTPKDQLSPLLVVTAGGLAGVATWAIAIPPDVIKSRWQTAAPGEYSGLWDVYRRLVQQEGYGALFKGIRPAMIRAFPANAACFMGMEVSRKLLYFMD